MLFRRRITAKPSPATLLEEGRIGARYYAAERERGASRLLSRATYAVFFLAFLFFATRSVAFQLRLSEAIEEGEDLLLDNTCVASRELKKKVSPAPFLIVRTSSKDVDRRLTLLSPAIEALEGQTIEAIVNDPTRCSEPMKVRRRARILVSFVDGSSVLSRCFGLREKLRLFQPASVCAQHALDEDDGNCTGTRART